MGRFCDHCGAEIGFFSRQRLRDLNDGFQFLCKLCVSTKKEEHAEHSRIEARQARIKLHVEMKDDYEEFRTRLVAYQAEGRIDRAWCIARTLVFSEQATSKEAAFFEKHKPEGFVRATQCMTEDTWRRVQCTDRRLGAIFSAIHDAVALLDARPHRTFGLKHRDRRTIETDQLQFSRVFCYTAKVLSVQMPDIYLQPEKRGLIAVVNASTKCEHIPSFVVYAHLLQGLPEKEIVFGVARWLAFMRPDHYLELCTATTESLQARLYAAIMLIDPTLKVPHEFQEVVRQYLPKLRSQLRPDRLEELRSAISEFGEPCAPLDLEKWHRDVWQTALRTGFILCDDLEVSAQALKAAPQIETLPSMETQICDLVRYSVSEDYFLVRAHLGLIVGN